MEKREAVNLKSFSLITCKLVIRKVSTFGYQDQVFNISHESSDFWDNFALQLWNISQIWYETFQYENKFDYQKCWENIDFNWLCTFYVNSH